MTAAVTEADAAARACLQAATPRSAQVLMAVLERWNDLTDAQRARVYALVEQLHQATSMRRAGQAMKRAPQ
jgi:hypothetical protein